MMPDHPEEPMTELEELRERISIMQAQFDDFKAMAFAPDGETWKSKYAALAASPQQDVDAQCAECPHVRRHHVQSDVRINGWMADRVICNLCKCTGNPDRLFAVRAVSPQDDHCHGCTCVCAACRIARGELTALDK